MEFSRCIWYRYINYWRKWNRKSETALELIKRGHRLVSDDAVDIKEIDGSLIGTSPKITIGMLEVRGIGIIDISSLYGLSSILPSKDINLLMHLSIGKMMVIMID